MERKKKRIKSTFLLDRNPSGIEVGVGEAKGRKKSLKSLLFFKKEVKVNLFLSRTI